LIVAIWKMNLFLLIKIAFLIRKYFKGICKQSPALHYMTKRRNILVPGLMCSKPNADRSWGGKEETAPYF
jgi:hypothetical protein